MEILKKIQQNIVLSPYTTFKLGGPAEYFLEAKDKQDLIDAIRWATDNKMNVYYLGGGSNLLINDQGVKGLVIRLMNNSLDVRGERLECGAGLLLCNAASAGISNALSGLEWSVGIPRATVGGSVRGNAGAFGTSIGEIVETVEVCDIKKQSFSIFSHNDCKFSYRTSIFKEDSRYLIWSVTLKMNKGEVQAIRAKMFEVAELRSNHYPKLPSAGSVFENLSKETVRQANSSLYERALKDGAFKGEKIGAGYIIDECGLKGKKIGGIKISLEHANHIVNTGDGTSDQVIMLISYVKQQVRDKYGILLKEEVGYLGFE
jgi:UDP-N-acetylmuramate dehydrogenase